VRKTEKRSEEDGEARRLRETQTETGVKTLGKSKYGGFVKKEPI